VVTTIQDVDGEISGRQNPTTSFKGGERVGESTLEKLRNPITNEKVKGNGALRLPGGKRGSKKGSWGLKNKIKATICEVIKLKENKFRKWS